jgi:hypothetical protein
MIGTDKRSGIKHIQVVETKTLISFQDNFLVSL